MAGINAYIVHQGDALHVEVFPVEGILKEFHNIVSNGVLCGEACGDYVWLSAQIWAWGKCGPYPWSMSGGDPNREPFAQPGTRKSSPEVSLPLPEHRKFQRKSGKRRQSLRGNLEYFLTG